MMTPIEQGVIHQLLGRMVYLHVHFIEPHESMNTSRHNCAWIPCCNHAVDRPPRTPSWREASASAWAVLVEVADSLPSTPRCRVSPDDCCATCVVAASAHAIAQRWIDVEREAYGLATWRPEETESGALLAGRRLSGIFAQQHDLRCRIRIDNAEILDAPSPDDLPLTGELLALWADPTGTDQAPVVSWLNHCAGLTDVARIVSSRRTTG